MALNDGTHFGGWGSNGHAPPSTRAVFGAIDPILDLGHRDLLLCKLPSTPFRVSPNPAVIGCGVSP